MPLHFFKSSARRIGAVTLALLTIGPVSAAPPNVVLIFCDDLGYADLSCYGSQRCSTPNLDRLAGQGVRFTDFYVPQAVCSASRAALLTGCYPNRVGIQGALGPRSKTGLPYSNDMWPMHPDYVNLPPDAAKRKRGYPDLPMIEGEKVVIPKVTSKEQNQLTTWYTEHAVDFITRNKARPFFLYLAHNMPHVPLHVSDKHRGKSGRGLYADVIAEIDWSVGQVLAALEKNGLSETTLVLFISDNGPWLLYGDHAGSAGVLREGKATEFDGGVRVPFIVRWPGKIPAGTVCREPAMTIDVLPTLAGLSGAKLPRDRMIDGRDIWPLISGQPGARSPQEAYFFYWGGHLQAVRSGSWKMHFPHSYPVPTPPGSGGSPGKYVQHETALVLFDLKNDSSETVDVAAQHPGVVARLQKLAEQCRADLGDTAHKVTGKNVRPSGVVEKPRHLNDPLSGDAVVE